MLTQHNKLIREVQTTQCYQQFFHLLLFRKMGDARVQRVNLKMASEPRASHTGPPRRWRCPPPPPWLGTSGLRMDSLECRGKKSAQSWGNTPQKNSESWTKKMRSRSRWVLTNWVTQFLVNGVRKDDFFWVRTICRIWKKVMMENWRYYWSTFLVHLFKCHKI